MRVCTPLKRLTLGLQLGVEQIIAVVVVELGVRQEDRVARVGVDRDLRVLQKTGVGMRIAAMGIASRSPHPAPLPSHHHCFHNHHQPRARQRTRCRRRGCRRRQRPTRQAATWSARLCRRPLRAEGDPHPPAARFARGGAQIEPWLPSVGQRAIDRKGFQTRHLQQLSLSLSLSSPAPQPPLLQSSTWTTIWLLEVGAKVKRLALTAWMLLKRMSRVRGRMPPSVGLPSMVKVLPEPVTP